MDKYFLDFERPLEEIYKQIQALEIVSKENPDLQAQIDLLSKKYQEKEKKLYSNLSSWEKVMVARHPERPHTSDFIKLIFDEFDELHGDRNFGDDPSIIGGLATLENIPVMIIGHEKGRGTQEKLKRNFGMPQPEGYRKAKRLMLLAEKFEIPIITFIDTSGAYPGIEGEERGQSEAIATNLAIMSDIETRLLSVVTGEGGSGGALAIGISDYSAMLENSVYSVASPEACASIVWRSSDMSKEAANAMKLCSQDLYDLELIDEIISEPIGGAHSNHNETALAIKTSLLKNLLNLNKMNIKDILEKRYQRLTSIGK
ncbi:MAG: acetyl-CoA carboxylase carboxyltransferase subunit alpha [Pseudomonadota bacterium]|nr:acetyl-CoA carboxylase carboxyltransferase subunit alpha [Pseudomonadota bacterium]